MDFAVSTLENPPVGTGMAEIAMPLDQRAVGLDHPENMCTVAGECHVCLSAVIVGLVVLGGLVCLLPRDGGRGRG